MIPPSQSRPYFTLKIRAKTLIFTPSILCIYQAGHVDKFKMLRGNAWDRSTWGDQEWGHCFILAMEVLDNLPHDRCGIGVRLAGTEEGAMRPHPLITMI